MSADLATDFSAIYRELERAARRYAHPGRTLDVSALVHEVFVRFDSKTQREGRWWKDRGHLLATACSAVGQVFLNYRRDQRCEKRGGGRRAVTLHHGAGAPVELDLDAFIDLDRAVHAFAEEDPERVRVVWLRLYGGLSVEETAAMLGLSTATVKRYWRVARLRLGVLLDDYEPTESCTGPEGGG